MPIERLIQQYHCISPFKNKINVGVNFQTQKLELVTLSGTYPTFPSRHASSICPFAHSTRTRREEIPCFSAASRVRGSIYLYSSSEGMKIVILYHFNYSTLLAQGQHFTEKYLKLHVKYCYSKNQKLRQILCFTINLPKFYPCIVFIPQSTAEAVPYAAHFSLQSQTHART